jgi:hypothetical protein
MPSSGSSESAAGIVAGGRRRENNGLLRASARGETLVVTGINVADSSLVRLLETRSNLTEEVLSYLDEVAARASELPAYFRAHVRNAGDGRAASRPSSSKCRWSRTGRDGTMASPKSQRRDWTVAAPLISDSKFDSHIHQEWRCSGHLPPDRRRRRRAPGYCQPQFDTRFDT